MNRAVRKNVNSLRTEMSELASGGGDLPGLGGPDALGNSRHGGGGGGKQGGGGSLMQEMMGGKDNRYPVLTKAIKQAREGTHFMSQQLLLWLRRNRSREAAAALRVLPKALVRGIGDGGAQGEWGCAGVGDAVAPFAIALPSKGLVSHDGLVLNIQWDWLDHSVEYVKLELYRGWDERVVLISQCAKNNGMHAWTIDLPAGTMKPSRKTATATSGNRGGDASEMSQDQGAVWRVRVADTNRSGVAAFSARFSITGKLRDGSLNGRARHLRGRKKQQAGREFMSDLERDMEAAEQAEAERQVYQSLADGQSTKQQQAVDLLAHLGVMPGANNNPGMGPRGGAVPSRKTGGEGAGTVSGGRAPAAQ